MLDTTIVPRDIKFSQWQENALHASNRRFDASRRFAKSPNDRNHVAKRIERIAANRLRDLGFDVALTGNNHPFDLWVGGLRAEVKCSRWRSNRWQCRLKNHEADVIIWCLLDDWDRPVHWFVIPMTAVTGQNLALWTNDPLDSLSKWLMYFEGWDLVGGLVRDKPPMGQMRLL